MLFAPEYQEIVRFKGDIQTIHLPKNESLYQNREGYEKFKNYLLEEEMICKDVDNEYILTEKGIFWGNTISRKLAEML